MIKVGVTGGIGSGKSTVCRIFALLGAAVYDSDSRAKILMNSDPKVMARIRELFGKEAYNETGLDRKYISERVFGNRPLLERLNAIVHPAVAKDFDRWAEKQQAPYVIEESAILFECGADKNMDVTIAVTAPEEIRIRRTSRRDNTDPEKVRARMAHQMSDEQRAERADYVILADDRHLIVPQIIDIHHKLIRL